VTRPFPSEPADPAEQLRHVAQLLGGHADWCRRNGLTLPADLALAYALAMGGHARPEMAAGNGSGDARCMTYAQTAEALAVSERTVRRLVRGGDLPTVDIGSSPRVRVTDLVAYVAGLPVRTVA
jgi:excisionase family DNA binding protein